MEFNMNWFKLDSAKKRFGVIAAVVALVATVAYAAGFERIPKDNLILGTGTSASKVVEFDVGLGAANPKLKGNSTNPKLQFAADGVSFLAFGSGGGGASGINVAINGDFELGIANNWTASGGAFVAETGANTLNGSTSASWDPSGSAQTLTSDEYDLPLVVDGQICAASFWYKNGDNQYKVAILGSSSGVLAQRDIVTAGPTVATEMVLPFICPTSETVSFRLESTANSALIYIDDVFIGTKDIQRKYLELSSVDDPVATLSGGAVLLSDGRILKTYDGAGTLSTDYGKALAINLDTIFGANPVNATTYTLAIDLNSLPVESTTTDTGEKFVPLVQANFVVTITGPPELDSRRYIPVSIIRSANTGTVWSGDGSSFSLMPISKHGQRELGTGETNYIVPSQNFTSVGDLDSVITSTASELPREHTRRTGFKVTADSNVQSTADYVYIDFTLDDVDLNKKLKLEWAQKQFGAYAAGELEVVITTQADRTVAVAVPDVTAIPAYDGVFTASFDTASTATLSLVIRATDDMADATGIVISDVIVGPGQIQSVPASGYLGDIGVTVTGNGSKVFTNTTDAWRQSDGTLRLKYFLSGDATASGSAATTQFTMVLPAGYTIDSTRLPAAFGNQGATLGKVQAQNIVSAGAYDAASNAYAISGSSVGFIDPSNASVVYRLSDLNVARTVDFVGELIVPIAEWAGAPNFSAINNDVEYAFNSSASTTANDTTSFSYGPSGALIRNITATLGRRVRFLTPIAATDQISLEVSTDQISWLPLTNAVVVGGDTLFPLVAQGSNLYGAGRLLVINSTDVDVLFGQYPSPTTGAYGTAGNAYTLVGNAYWRLKKARANAATSFSWATPTSSGLVNTTTQSFGGDKTFNGVVTAGAPGTLAHKFNGSLTVENTSTGSLTVTTTNANADSFVAINSTSSSTPQLRMRQDGTTRGIIRSFNGTPFDFLNQANNSVGSVSEAGGWILGLAIETNGIRFNRIGGNSTGNADCAAIDSAGFNSSSEICLVSWNSSGVPQSCAVDGGSSNIHLCLQLR